MTRTLHAIELIALVPLALIHCLLLRLDRWLWPPAPAPAPQPAVVQACRAPAPAAGRQAPALADLSVHQLRQLAQQRGIHRVGDRRTSKGRRADLIAALA